LLPFRRTRAARGLPLHSSTQDAIDARLVDLPWAFSQSSTSASSRVLNFLRYLLRTPPRIQAKSNSDGMTLGPPQFGGSRRGLAGTNRRVLPRQARPHMLGKVHHDEPIRRVEIVLTGFVDDPNTTHLRGPSDPAGSYRSSRPRGLRILHLLHTWRSRPAFCLSTWPSFQYSFHFHLASAHAMGSGPA